MKITVIDNNEIYSSLLSKVIGQHGFESLSINPLGVEIETTLQKLKGSPPSLIFLNAETCFNQSENPSSHAGIDFLKHIRLTKDLGKISEIPTVIYSYSNKDALLRSKPENLIILSPGSYYLNVFDLNRSITKGLLQDDNGFLLGDIWLEPINDLAQLKPYVEADTRDILLEDRHSIANWWGPQRLLQGYRLTTDKPVVPPGNPVMLNFEKEKKKLAVKKLLFIKDSTVSLENPRKKVIPNDLTPEAYKGKDISDLLINKDGTYKKVLYIDDEAETGWANAFKQILYPSIESIFFKDEEMESNSFAISHNGQKVFEVYKSFKDAEDYISPDTLKEIALIVLDLRDKEKDKDKLQPDELTGVRLLKKIKDRNNGDPSIPVIIVTASNKQWNYERVLDLGANGYWIKESPEFGIDDEYSLINYLRLRNSIVELLSQNYLREIWWEGIIPCRSKLIADRKNQVYDLLMKAFLNLQYTNDMNFIYKVSEVYPLQDVLLFAAMAWEKYTGSYSLKDADVNIVDYLLYRLRGISVHGTETDAKLLTEDDVKIFFIWFKNLLVENEKYQGIKLQWDTTNKHHKFKNFISAGNKFLALYVNIWNLLKSSGKQYEKDAMMIRDRATKILEKDRGCPIEFNAVNEFVKKPQTRSRRS